MKVQYRNIHKLSNEGSISELRDWWYTVMKIRPYSWSISTNNRREVSEQLSFDNQIQKRASNTVLLYYIENKTYGDGGWGAVPEVELQMCSVAVKIKGN